MPHLSQSQSKIMVRCQTPCTSPACSWCLTIGQEVSRLHVCHLNSYQAHIIVLLEHLYFDAPHASSTALTVSIDVFFTHAPQMPRMIHRHSFMTRLKLPPVHLGFPHSSLLHAMCAFASTYTAWVSNLPPDSLDRAIERHKEMNGNLDEIADFGLAQATAAQKSISLATQSTMMQSGHILVEICQACVSQRWRFVTRDTDTADYPHRYILREEYANARLDSRRHASSHLESARDYE